MALKCPRLVIAGLSGDSGKTVTSLSLLTALRRRGLRLSVFKKGPDYIDAAWLSWASGSACRNLDTYMVGADGVLASFARAAAGTDIAVIEGNRGLFDGKDAEGTHSTASLARLLGAPVVLVVDCTKSTRTIAALVKGCQVFEPGLNLAGVIMNQVAGERHRRVITAAIEQACHLPVVGALPRFGYDDTLIPGRHLGLVTPAEFGGESGLEARLSMLADNYLNIDSLLEIAQRAEPLEAPEARSALRTERPVRVGWFRDSAFTFYYPENLEALESAGSHLVAISSLDDAALPDIDALYIGGGFPETHAERLSENHALRDAVRTSVDAGLPVYAECGGLIFLCRELSCGERRYPMAGVFPIELGMHDKPAGHGYTEISVDRPNPFFEVGATILGHEFHYSGPTETLSDEYGCMRVTSGVGLGNKRDGLLYKNCLACYFHLHAGGVPTWATSLVGRAAEYRATRRLRDQAEGRVLGCAEKQGRRPVCELEMTSQSGIEARPLASGC